MITLRELHGDLINQIEPYPSKNYYVECTAHNIIYFSRAETKIIQKANADIIRIILNVFSYINIVKI